MHIFRYEKNKNGKWPFTLKNINRIMVLNVITAHCVQNNVAHSCKKILIVHR